MYESSTPVPSSVFNNKKIIFWGSFSLFKLRCFIHTLGMLLITKTNRAVLHLTRLLPSEYINWLHKSVMKCLFLHLPA